MTLDELLGGRSRFDVWRVTRITPKTLSDWARGKRRPRRDAVDRLAAVYWFSVNVTPHEAGYGRILDRNLKA